VACAVIVVAVVLFAAGLLYDLPRAVLSAIVIQAVWGLMDVGALRRYKRVRRNDFVSSMAAMVGVLLLGPLYGLLAAIAQSVLGLVYRSSRVDVDVMGRVPGEKAAWGSVDRHPEREQADGILVLRLDAPLFWANSAEIHDRILSDVDAHPGVRALLVDLEASNQLDTTSVDSLTSLLGELRERDVELYLVRVLSRVRDVLRNSGFLDDLGPGRVWHSISQGVRAARDELHLPKHAPLPVEDAGAESDVGPEDERIAAEHDHPDEG
jgi:MFS superfamily sulfate permease-like transporter